MVLIDRIQTKLTVVSIQQYKDEFVSVDSSSLAPPHSETFNLLDKARFDAEAKKFITQSVETWEKDYEESNFVSQEPPLPMEIFGKAHSGKITTGISEEAEKAALERVKKAAEEVCGKVMETVVQIIVSSEVEEEEEKKKSKGGAGGGKNNKKNKKKGGK